MQDVQQAQRLIEEASVDVFQFGIHLGGDRKSLISIQNIVRRFRPDYHYIEIGSDAGGSLYTHLIDEKCGCVTSIDLRPGSQPDERGVSFDYNGLNTTKNMIQNLEQHLPLGSLLKLRTFDIDASQLPATTPGFDLGFIDGEHTNAAAFQDFLSLYKFAKDDCVVLFHDANLVTDAILNTNSFLRYNEIDFDMMFLPDVICAFFIGKFVDFSHPLKRFAYNKDEFAKSSKEDLWNGIAQRRSTTSAINS